MLVLQRKVGEQVVLNPGQPDEIVVEIVEIDGGRVRLGFAAPAAVKIVRTELTPQGHRTTRKGSK